MPCTWEELGVGQEGMNNGVVLLAAIKDRRVTVQVGYGIEPYITDGGRNEY